MSKTASNNVEHSRPAISNWSSIPCVQFGFSDEDRPFREPKLHTIFDPVPQGATTASPVYNLSRTQFEYQDQLETGYEVKGRTSIATKLQDDSESAGRVLYPIHIESDRYHEESVSTLHGWFHTFVEEYLEVPFTSCKLYFSGNRSIHIHVPRFVSKEEDRLRLKEIAESFCDETGASLDCGLYDRKRMFRLPGAKHAKTGLSKVRVESTWDKDRIFQESFSANPELPDSYEAVLREVFLDGSTGCNRAGPEPYAPQDLFRTIDPEQAVLELVQRGAGIETPLLEQIEYPENDSQVPLWAQYNAKEFSPYALADGNRRSVAAVEVKGGAFARKGVRNGATLIPAYFYGARGCAGEEFTKADEHAPLQLSKIDYRKWNFEAGDDVLIIGGKSASSIITDLEPWQATVVGHALSGEEGSRAAALEFLEQEGYNIGASGRGENAAVEGESENDGIPSDGEEKTLNRTDSIAEEDTPAASLLRQAEQSGVETLSHQERSRVACRLLLHGWSPAWEWFKEQYGDQFKPDYTRQQFKIIVGSYPEYDHVEVPQLIVPSSHSGTLVQQELCPAPTVSLQGSRRREEEEEERPMLWCENR